jgi:hypothetical protein
MKGLELIQNYPAAGKVVKEWFFKSMLESFKDDSVPDEFKEFMLEQGIEDDKIGTLIDINPRMLLDVFDDNAISINIIRTNNSIEEWDWELVPGPQENSVCKSRKEAELFAIEAAFEMLEEKLTPIEFPKLEE